MLRYSKNRIKTLFIFVILWYSIILWKILLCRRDAFDSVHKVKRGVRMKGHIKSELGHVEIENDVLARYAGSAAIECFGVVGMASVNMKDGIVHMLQKNNIRHGVSVSISENRINIALHIVVAYGVSIQAVADNLLANVSYRIEKLTGMEIEKIKILVEGVRVVD